jgi:hypothetical protein
VHSCLAGFITPRCWCKNEICATLTHEDRFAMSRTFVEVENELEIADEMLRTTSDREQRHVILRAMRSLLEEAEALISEPLESHSPLN